MRPRRSRKPDDAGTDFTPADVRRIAQGLLSRREHSGRELRRKLVARGVGPQLAAETVQALEAEGLQSDARLAEALVRSSVDRGRGPVRIRLDLEERGVAGELIERAIEDAGQHWDTLAGNVRIKRFGAAAPADYRDRARQTRFLQYRGFTAEQVAAAIDAGGTGEFPPDSNYE